MRSGVVATLLAIAAPAAADPGERLELTGFVGVASFADDIGLGGSLAPEQRPQTAPAFGARLSYVLLRSGGDIHLDLAAEAELSFAASWTGYGFDDLRESYFAPVFGYRGGLMARLGGGWLQPHLTASGGAATVSSSSPYMAKETDPVFAWGVGTTFAVGGGWQLRLDGRQVVMESMTGDTTSSYELLVSIGARLGGKRAGARPVETKPSVDVVVEKPPEPVRDSVGERVAAEPDPDGDGIVGAADRCPDEPEDFDGFEDEDGCPDPDNDKDGIPDVRDACPNEPETVNGIDDHDGCPDQIPGPLLAALSSASEVTFEANRARLSKAGKATLDKALVAMLNNPRIKIAITVRAEKAGERHDELARKRADVVKWYLIEQGVAQGSLSTAVGAPVADKKAPLLVLSVAI